MATRKRGGRYMADFMVAGNRHRESFDTEDAAKAWEHDVRAAIKLGREMPSVGNGRAEGGKDLSTLGALFDHCKTELPWKGAKAEVSSIRAARASVDVMGRNVKVAALTEDYITDHFVAELIERGDAGGTINRKLAALSVMLRKARKKKVIKDLPTMPRQQEGAARSFVLLPAQEDAVVTLFRRWGAEDVADFTIVAVETGARLGELLKVRWSHIPAPGDRVSLWNTKNGSDRTVLLTRMAQAALDRRRKADPDSPGPFTHLSSRVRLRSYWDRMRATLELPDFVIHSLRHTCATRLVSKGFELPKLMKWMGWKSVQMALRYSHLNADDLKDGLALLERPAPQLREVA